MAAGQTERHFRLLPPPFLLGTTTGRNPALASLGLHFHAFPPCWGGRERKLVSLLEQPGPGTTQADPEHSSLMTHLAIHGNAFVAKYRESGDVVQLPFSTREGPSRGRGGRLRFRYTPGARPQRLLSVRRDSRQRISVDGVRRYAVSQASRVIGLSDELVKHALSFFNSSEFQRP